MKIEVIKTKTQYKKALIQFEEVFLAKSNTIEGKKADLLALIIKNTKKKIL